MKKLALYFSLAALTLISFSCAKKDNNTVTPTTYQLNQLNGQCTDQNGNVVPQTLCANNGYSYNAYGQCVQTATGQPVQPQLSYLCQQQTNGMYSCVQSNTGATVPNQYCLSGNYGYSCVQTTTRQPVAPQLCQQTTSGGGVVQQQCYGPYLYNGQVYQCGIQYNCSGTLMTSVQTNQQVQCL